MKNWLEKTRTTNCLLLVIALLLGAHLLINLPLLPVAGAQQGMNIKTKQDEYLKSMDKNIDEIHKHMNTMDANLSLIRDCVASTPTGGKAILTKETGIR